MDSVIRDMRWALRSLMRAKGTTLAAVLCLALGIGATTTVWTALRALVLNPVPAADASRLVLVSELPPEAPDGTSGVSPATWRDWRTELRSFDAVAAYHWVGANLTFGEISDHVSGHHVSGDFFEILGARAALGRTLQPMDETSGDRPIVLGDALWRRMFGADPRVIGQVVRVDGEPHTVVGVMEQDFVFPAGAGFWVPIDFPPALAAARGPNWLEAFARLAPGVTVESATAELAAFEERIAAAYPEQRANWTAFAAPMQAWYGRNPRPFVAVLMAAVAFVVLIGCANVANLLLARGAGREREVAIRGSLGASRARIMRQFLTESLVLAMLAGLAGVLLALWGVYLFRNAIPPELIQFNPGWTRIGVDVRALLFTLVVSLATGITFGVLPAVQAARHDPQGILREGSRGATTSRAARRLRSALVAVEVALALVLVLGTGVMVRGLAGLVSSDPGYRTDRALTFEVTLPRDAYADPAERIAFFDRLQSGLDGSAGVEGAGLTSILPMAWNESATRGMSEAMAGRLEGELPVIRTRTLSPGYFDALGVPLLEGRDIGRVDGADGEPVVVVSRRMARLFWPGEEAIGRRVRLLGDDTWRRVVGVVGDVRHNPNVMDEMEMPTLYVPLAQRPPHRMSVIVRTTGEPAAFARAARAVLAGLDPDLAAGDVMTLDRLRSNALSPQRLTTATLAVFGTIAMILAGIGVFGVVSLAVRQRTEEIGVRIALGARPRDVLRMILRDGSRPVLAGVAMGLLGATFTARAVTGLIHGTQAGDPVTFALGTMLLAGVAFAACLLPALRATRYDPARLLRYD